MIITKLHLLLGVGNLKTLYDKLLSYHPEMMVLDAGYKTPAIVHLLIEDQIEPLFHTKVRKQRKDSSENMSMYTTNTMIAIYVWKEK